MAKWPRSMELPFTADAIVTTHPCWLHSATILVSTTGGDASLYEGQDAASGRLLITLKGSANVTNQRTYSPPLWLERGLYVDVGSNVTQVTVHFTPHRLNPSDRDE
jgi:hypothetical protein